MTGNDQQNKDRNSLITQSTYSIPILNILFRELYDSLVTDGAEMADLRPGPRLPHLSVSRGNSFLRDRASHREEDAQGSREPEG